MRRIKYLVMDVDGTLTDGKIYMGNDGEVFKAFSIKDGYGIKDILPKHEIVPVIITARKSRILENRCRELEITHIYQGVQEKMEKLARIIAAYNEVNQTGFTLADCAYIGDDIADLRCMESIKASGGVVGCPCDASDSVVAVADYIAKCKGGEGAVREFIEWIINEE